jgi:hypothetical protein
MPAPLPTACPGCNLPQKVNVGFFGPDKNARCTRCQTLLVTETVRVSCIGCIRKGAIRWVQVRRRWYGLDNNATCPVCGTALTGLAGIEAVLGPGALGKTPHPFPRAGKRTRRRRDPRTRIDWGRG